MISSDEPSQSMPGASAPSQHRPVVSLTNAGLVPLEAITTMGINVKECESPIGFFGTGLKYAISSLLRLGHNITIWRGLDRYDFSTLPADVRGKSFDFIWLHGPNDHAERLGFTTHLGAKWEMWQVFRELYSNCLDEAGALEFGEVEPAPGRTTIRVTGDAFAEAAHQRDLYFLSGKPIYRSPLVEVRRGRSQGIYYRGVLAAKLSKPSAHTYNITTTLDLTEDRTIKSIFMAEHYVSYMLAKCGDRSVLEPVLCGGDDLFESSFEFTDPCAGFSEIVLALCEARGLGAVNVRARKRAEEWAQREARVPEASLTRYESSEIEAARAFLARIGYPITAPIIVTETLGPGVFGMAKDGRIYIAKLALARGGNFLIGTILEEHLHLTHGFLDESRRFQDFLIDLVVRFAREAMFEREAA